MRAACAKCVSYVCRIVRFALRPGRSTRLLEKYALLWDARQFKYEHGTFWPIYSAFGYATSSGVSTIRPGYAILLVAGIMASASPYEMYTACA